MLENQKTVIDGVHCVLVPYLPCFVPKYHAWMGDPELLEATASERLTLEEEIENCESWRTDPTKLTFIILDRLLPDDAEAGNAEAGGDTGGGVPLGLGGGMCGDVNLFLNDSEDSEAAEIEIMVAERASRRRGIAREALELMMRYARERLGLRLFRAKIGFANAPSLALFSRLGFEQVSRSEVFQEATMERRVDCAGGGDGGDGDGGARGGGGVDGKVAQEEAGGALRVRELVLSLRS